MVEDLGVVFICAHAVCSCLCVYQFAWKSHVTLKRILLVGAEFVNFMYLFSSLVSHFLSGCCTVLINFQINKQ